MLNSQCPGPLCNYLETQVYKEMMRLKQDHMDGPLANLTGQTWGCWPKTVSPSLEMLLTKVTFYLVLISNIHSLSVSICLVCVCKIRKEFCEIMQHLQQHGWTCKLLH